jgi:hypothetical protein
MHVTLCCSVFNLESERFAEQHLKNDAYFEFENRSFQCIFSSASDNGILLIREHQVLTRQGWGNHASV